MSRAREHALLIANFDYLRRKVRGNAFVHKIVNLFEQEGKPLHATELLPLGAKEWFEALRPLEPHQIKFDEHTAGIFSEGTFYPAFFHDLCMAQESIVVFSPFATAKRAGEWIDLLRAKMAEGVRIRLVTRPPTDQAGIWTDEIEELLADLRGAGAVVDFRARMHEKFAIIDSSILWHGSLNILSHATSSESMLRIPSSAACAEMAKLVGSQRAGASETQEHIDLTQRENPPCHECRHAFMVWKSGRYGVYFECQECGAKINIRKLRGSRRKRGRRCGPSQPTRWDE